MTCFPWGSQDPSNCLAIGLTALLCVLLLSCQDVATIWSTESRSPDGLWVATAQAEEYGGPGTAGLVSNVYLRRIRGRRDRIEILVLHHDSISVKLAASGTVKLSWLTSSHLEITFQQPAKIDFQVVKCAGIDISIRDIWGPL